MRTWHPKEGDKLTSAMLGECMAESVHPIHGLVKVVSPGGRSGIVPWCDVRPLGSRVCTTCSGHGEVSATARQRDARCSVCKGKGWVK